MATTRKRKTLADYLVVALCPLLIMALVGSIAFFLLELSYHGLWSGRLRWVLFWFVIAAVLISRISMEQGSASARVYGILLALATGALMYRLIGVTIAGWGLLAFIWWCTSKLTWDCTLVDDAEDASGEGLLQVAGLENSAAEPAENETPEGKPKRKSPWWQRLTGSRVKRGGRPHAPGSWVIYFSLLALPAFGFGQAYFPTEDAAQREYGFKLLGVYVAAALGLLLATSFLGLRRYLRQRSLAMPATMAGFWILLGTLLAGAIMLSCLLIPRPDGSRTLTQMVENIATNAVKQASKYAAIPGEAAKGEGRRIGTGDEKAKQQSKETSKSGEPKKEETENQTKPEKSVSDKETPDQPKEQPTADPDGKNGPSGQKSEPDSASQTNQPASPQPAKPKDYGWVATAVKWLIYGVIIAAILFVLYRFRREVSATLRQMWATLAEMLASLFAWRPKSSDPTAPAPPATTPDPIFPGRRFSSIANPFTTGTTETLTPEELVTYTFNALQVWAAERDLKRLPDQTPLEFSGRLGEAAPEVGVEARAVALLYTRLAYAQQPPTTEGLEDLARLWDAMEIAAARRR
jgi:hypothetical protein